MKFNLVFLVAAATPAFAICPMGAQMMDSLKREAQLSKRDVDAKLHSRQAGTFSESQRVDVTGEHRFIPPGPDDLRGPCTGLNAMANHGYIPRSGIVDMVQVAEAARTVYNLNFGGGLFLSTLATVFSGDPVTRKWSIGGPPPPGLLARLGVAGAGKGISNGHNRVEGDASATRGDAYLHGGDASSLRLERFQALYDLAKNDAVPNYNIDVIAKHRKYSFNRSKDTNPYFFYSPGGSLIVATGAHALIPGLMSNHSAEYPDGILDKETLKSFHAITEKPNRSFSYTPGHERIPDIWYRRPDEYTGQKLNEDLVTIFRAAPESLTVGGNTGTVNSYQGVDISDITGSAYRTQDLLDPKKLGCFIYQLYLSASPDLLREGLVGTVLDTALDLLTTNLKPLVDPQCVPITDFDDSALDRFAGSALRR